jgi:hypothetical protein
MPEAEKGGLPASSRRSLVACRRPPSGEVSRVHLQPRHERRGSAVALRSCCCSDANATAAICSAEAAAGCEAPAAPAAHSPPPLLRRHPSACQICWAPPACPPRQNPHPLGTWPPPPLEQQQQQQQEERPCFERPRPRRPSPPSTPRRPSASPAAPSSEPRRRRCRRWSSSSNRNGTFLGRACWCNERLQRWCNVTLELSKWSWPLRCAGVAALQEGGRECRASTDPEPIGPAGWRRAAWSKRRSARPLLSLPVRVLGSRPCCRGRPRTHRPG